MCETVVTLDMQLTHVGLSETSGVCPLQDYQPDLPLPERIRDGSSLYVSCGVPAQY